METNEPPFESREHDMTGMAALDFTSGSMQTYMQLFENYNPDRFTPVNLKLMLEGEGFTLTLYAFDNQFQSSNEEENVLPVKKFKVLVPITELPKHVSHLALVFSNEKFDISKMRVINT